LFFAKFVPRAAVRTGRRPSRRCGSLTILALVSAGAACSGCAEPSSAKRDPVTLRIGVAAPKTGDAGSGVQSFVGNLLSETLVGLAWDGRPIGKLVSDIISSEDGLTVQLRLRKNLQFHDGTPIDIGFVKQNLERLFKTSSVSYASVRSVEVVEPDLLKITLSRPEALLLSELSVPWLAHPTNPDVGVGAFRLVERKPKVRLAASPDYYRGRPAIDFIEVQEYDEQRSSWAALMRGEIDAVHEITPGAIDFVEAEGQTNIRTFPFLRPYYIQLVFNVRHPVLKQAAVRQALSYAVDRQAIIDLALNRQGMVAEGPIWPFHWAYSTARKTYTHNVEAATLRLDSAGLRMKPSPEPGRMPSRLRFRCLTVSKESRFEKIALVLQKQLYEIGVDMQIEALPTDEMVKRLKVGDFDTILIQRTSGRSLHWTYVSFHSQLMPIGYNAADGVLEGLRRATSDGEVRNGVSELQQIFHDDPPAIFIAWPQVARAVSTKFEVPEEKDQREATDKGRDVISSLWLWKPADPVR
jgi:ABC-type transport system substrate-binding protein